MTNDEKLMQQALDALEFGGWNMTTRAINALRRALEQPAPVAKPHEQEPFGWVVEHKHGGKCFSQTMAGVYTDTAVKITTVYTHPQACEPLTDEEIEDEWRFLEAVYIEEVDPEGYWGPCNFEFARAIEAKLKQKNGYAEEKNT